LRGGGAGERERQQEDREQRFEGISHQVLLSFEEKRKGGADFARPSETCKIIASRLSA
jgi:hypothetical protein